jgi:hypothetical protein
MKKTYFYALLLSSLLSVQLPALAQNPLIMDQFTADPTARVFEGKLYLYPSHDILATPGHGRVGWFAMNDYHVFSSENLTSWIDHGKILTERKVPWADSTAYSMWAPDCVMKDGKYYFYFPAMPNNKLNGGSFGIGVAVSSKPYGPFVPQAQPISDVNGIDPNVFIDADGQAYLYWAEGKFYAAKLKSNMLELDSKPEVLANFPEKGLKEGPFMFKRNGTYYLTYPHVQNKTERLEYATSNNPLGPFKFAGVIMDESASGCWTNHQSIVKYKKQWYLFYHDDDLSPKFDKSRSVRADSLFFNADGTIRKVVPTRRGIGVTPASQEIQVDRYSDISKQGVAVDYLDTVNRMKGWKVILNENEAWVRYNSVDFGKRKIKSLNIKAKSKQGSRLEIRLDKKDGVLLSSIDIPENTNWQVSKSTLAAVPSGKHDLFIILENSNVAEIDWVSFQ